MGTSVIDFSISTTGSQQTIAPSSALPSVTVSALVNGWSQGGAGYTAAPLIELDGAGAGSGTNGLVLAAGSNGSVVNGLVVSGFSAGGISISSNNDLVEGCYIGTNAAGSAALANGGDGIDVYGASETIGGTTAGERNLISGNLGAGINILASAQDTVVTGNFVGTDVSGSYAIANVDDGLFIYGSDSTIGGTASGAGNLFSANDNAGILLYGSGAVGNLVEGNLIGTSASGSQALGEYLRRRRYPVWCDCQYRGRDLGRRAKRPLRQRQLGRGHLRRGRDRQPVRGRLPRHQRRRHRHAAERDRRVRPLHRG